MGKSLLRTAITFAFSFLFHSITYGLSENDWINLKPIKSSFVKGEPIYISVSYNKTPLPGYLSLNGELCHQPLKLEWPIDIGLEREGGNTAPAVPHFIDETINTEEPLRILCDFKIKDMKNRSYDLCYKEKSFEKCTSFVIEDPKGVDSQLFKRMNPYAHDFHDSGLSLQEILEKYPNSIYAAWIIMGDPWAVKYWQRHDPYDLLRFSMHVKDEDKKQLKIQAKVIKNVISKRHDFPYLIDFKIKYCLLLWQLGERGDCIKNLTKFAKENDSDSSIWAKKCLIAVERLLEEHRK